MNLKPIKSKLVVFAVPIRRKIERSLLYKGAARSDMYSRAEEVWIYSCGPEVKQSFRRGQKAYLSDGFELYADGHMPDLWAECCDAPEFAELKRFAASVDGDIEVHICHEWSILAVEE